MSDVRSDGPSDPVDGLTRRCHLTGEERTSEVWYTKTIEEDGRRRRVYASPEPYWQLDAEDREAYQREARQHRPAEGRHPDPSRQASAQVAPGARRGPPDDVEGVIVVDGLEKTYPDGTQAVKDASFNVHKGEIFGVLGPNGAGKSTLIGMLGTLVKPTGGQASVAGFDVVQDPQAIKPILGFALQEVGVDELATGREFLRLQARLYGLPKDEADQRATALLDLVGLGDQGAKRIGGYSGGMKRKVDLASALIHEPEIIFLDEPTEGLDPRARQELWTQLLTLRDQTGATILLSTHYMEEADHLCDRLAIIDQGRIVAVGTPEELKASVGRQSIHIEYDPPGHRQQIQAATELLQGHGLDGRLQATETGLHIYTEDPAKMTPKLLRLMEQADLAPDGLRIQEATLDDVYLTYTGRSIEEAEAADRSQEAPA